MLMPVLLEAAAERQIVPAPEGLTRAPRDRETNQTALFLMINLVCNLDAPLEPSGRSSVVAFPVA